MLFLFTNRNEVITWKSIYLGKNQPEQSAELQLNVYKGALHFIELCIVYLQCDPFHSWFLCDLSHFWCCTWHAYMCAVWDKTIEGCLHLSPLMCVIVSSR